MLARDIQHQLKLVAAENVARGVAGIREQNGAGMLIYARLHSLPHGVAVALLRAGRYRADSRAREIHRRGIVGIERLRHEYLVAVVEDACHCHLQRLAAARGDEVFDDNDLLARLEAAFNLVFAAVILAGAADVAHGQAHHLRSDGGVGDTGGAGPHEDLGIRVFAADSLHEGGLDLGTDLRGGQDEAVIAVDRAFDAAGPGERFVRPEKDSVNRE